jgi:hypothetical protein
MLNFMFLRYVTIQRSRKPATEADVSERDPGVQDVTTEIGPVYTGTSERQPETRVQIVTPIRTDVTEKQAASRKFGRGGDLQTATPEPELKVSARSRQSEAPVGTYPQYVDVTSVGRRRHNTTPESPLEPLSYVEINSIARRRNINHNNDVFTANVSPSLQPQTEPSQAESQPQHVDIATTGRTRTSTTANIAITEDSSASTTIPTVTDNHQKYTDSISRSRGNTGVTSYSGVVAYPTEVDTSTYRHTNEISRTRDATVRITDIPSSETHPPETDTGPDVQTIPSPTTPITLIESSTQGQSVPNTIVPPTSTGFTPTVTRVITSVTESGTTERQRISINRVPYIAIAALRGQTVYPGLSLQNKHQTVPADQRLLNATRMTTVPSQYELIINTSVEQSIIPVTKPSEHTLEKVMEVNKITLVTLKEEMPLAYTRALSGNEATERVLVEGQSGPTMDKVSEVSRLKHVTVVGGNQTATPAGDQETDALRSVFTTLSTPPGIPSDTRYYENDIDILSETQSAGPHHYHRTDSIDLDNYDTDLLSVTEPMVPLITSKETETTTAVVNETSSTDKPTSSVSPLSNRRRQYSGRKPGIDDFKRRRTRINFSTSAAPIAPSTPSTFSYKRRGQRKRPTSSTTVSEEDAVVLPSAGDVSVANRTADTNRDNEPRRTFIPKRGQRRRPRPYTTNSTSTTSADEVINPVENDGSENNVLVSDITVNTTTGFIPKTGNRQRGKTQKLSTETSNTTSRTNTNESDNLKTIDKELKDLDTYNSSENSESITGDVHTPTFSPENKSRFVPKNGHKNESSSTEPNLKQTFASDIEATTIKHSQSTESLIISNSSPDSEFESESDITNLNLDLNSTETAKGGRAPGVKEIPKQTTFRPSSLRAYMESVTPRSGVGHGDRLRVKKRRRRPVTHSLVPPSAQTEETLTESTSEGKTPSWHDLRVTQNEIKSINSTADKDIPRNNPENISVTLFATAALLGRDRYELTSPGSVVESFVTGDREEKRPVNIPILNDESDTTVYRWAQKNKPVSNRNNINVRKSTNDNTSNDLEPSSYDSELTTGLDSDLSSDGSGNAAGNIGRDSIYTPPASVNWPEEIQFSFMTQAVESPTEETSRKTSETTTKASTTPQFTGDFIPSVDFTAESGVDQSLGSTAARDRNKQGSSGPEGKRRHLVRGKRPNSTTVEPQAQSEVG